jgi:hypothetical protein
MKKISEFLKQTLINCEKIAIEFSEKSNAKKKMLSSIKTMADINDVTDEKEIIDLATMKIDQPFIGDFLAGMIDEYSKLALDDIATADEFKAIKRIMAAINSIDIDIDDVSHVDEPSPKEEYIDAEIDIKETYTTPEIKIEEKKEEEVKAESTATTFRIPDGFRKIDSEYFGFKGDYAINHRSLIINLRTGKSYHPFKDGNGRWLIELEGRKFILATLVRITYGIGCRPEATDESNVYTNFNPDEGVSSTEMDCTEETETGGESATASDDNDKYVTIPTEPEIPEKERLPVMITWIKDIPGNKYKLFPDGRVYDVIHEKWVKAQRQGTTYSLSSTTCVVGDRTSAMNKHHEVRIDSLMSEAYGVQ